VSEIAYAGLKVSWGKMKRREFITLFGGAAATWPLAVRAQQPEKTAKIGYLTPRSALAHERDEEAFLHELRDLGYLEGKNITFQYRFAEGNLDRLPRLAAELVQLKVDVIVTEGTQASLAAKAATRVIPIVMMAVGNPIDIGLVASLARPGGNVTGTSSLGAEVAGRSLQFLYEIVPDLSRVAVLWNSANAFQGQMLQETQAAAKFLGIELLMFAAKDTTELDQVFAVIGTKGVGGIFVLADRTFLLHRKRITGLAEKNRLPAMYAMRDFATSGGLMAYGPDLPALFRRVASYVDKMLKGAHPADLPVEQATKFELIINLRTARALGLNVPIALQGRADEVIE
jgi:putative tryptophan/tyrosine transport system substrate-binding protein